MKNYYLFRYILLLPIVLFLNACGEPVVLDIKPNELPPKVVIFGTIDDQIGADTIRVSFTSSFGSTITPGIPDALVILESSEGYRDTLSYVKDGKYATNPDFVGVQDGPTYKLSVTYAGKTYTAQDRMPRIVLPAIDSFQVEKRTSNDPPFFEDGYFVKAYARVFNQQNNFYMFNFYRNDTLLNNDVESGNYSIFIQDLSFVNDQINGLDIPYRYNKGDLAKAEILGITRTAFNFWSDVINQINSDGGMFSTPPANVKGNIEGGALGLFQVAAIYSDTTTIK